MSSLDKLLAYSCPLGGYTRGLHQFICLSHDSVNDVDWSYCSDTSVSVKKDRKLSWHEQCLFTCTFIRKLLVVGYVRHI